MCEEGDTKTFRQAEKQREKSGFIQRLVADVRKFFPSIWVKNS